MYQLPSALLHSARGLRFLYWTPQFHRTFSHGHSALPLLNQRALITGGTRGIGLSIAKVLASAGCSCVLVGRDSATLSKVQHELAMPGGNEKHGVLAGDVKERSFWDEVKKGYTDLDILVNAAGITHNSLLIAMKYDTIDEVINTNLLGSIYGCRAVLKNMVRRKGGKIINISSVLGSHKGGKGSAAYAASKAGVLGLTKALADEYGGHKVRVNAILPGYIKTDMTDAMSKEASEIAWSQIPINRFGTSEDVAHAALFLLTNEYTNGSEVVVDGGLSTF
ncbi:hypothetical protein DFP73DRAFT_90771 [Morchella snyderi]|nr:hypothetical protein DFP73DRAFT_90771 [Morchella snyderi]